MCIRDSTGACILLTADNKLAGIFTHGDFVRAYGANPLIGEPVSYTHLFPPFQPVLLAVSLLLLQWLVLLFFYRRRISFAKSPAK